jgi:hypothetical protein
MKGHRKTVKLRRQTKALDGTKPLDARIAPGERDTDRVLAALRRRMRVTATVKVAAQDSRGQRASKTLRMRLR